MAHSLSVTSVGQGVLASSACYSRVSLNFITRSKNLPLLGGINGVHGDGSVPGSGRWAVVILQSATPLCCKGEPRTQLIVVKRIRTCNRRVLFRRHVGERPVATHPPRGRSDYGDAQTV